MKIWVARRSSTIITYPNMLDSTVAGGVSAGYTPFETIIREADEEASFPEDLVRGNIRSVEVLTYMTLLEEGQVKPDMCSTVRLGRRRRDVVPKPHS